MYDKTEDYRIAELTDCETLKDLIDMLHKFVMGDLKLSDKQAEAAMLIISKAIPALKPISMEEAGIV